jgi:hypothetical protein
MTLRQEKSTMCQSVFAKPVALFVVCGLSLSVVGAEDRAEQILRASQDYVAARSVEIRQAVEQTSAVFIDGKPSGPPQSTKQTSVIEIDAGKMVVRLTTKDQSGNDLEVLRKGDRIALKVGAGPWMVPAGPYAQMGEQLANPFACPLPKAGQENSPRWMVVGSEREAGLEAAVIETVGDTANQYAQERMREGIASIIPDPTKRPKIDVLAYKSRHWIGNGDNRRLRVEQTSHQKMTLPGPANAVIDVTAKTTAVYGRYDKVEIDVPEEARQILGGFE